MTFSVRIPDGTEGPDAVMVDASALLEALRATSGTKPYPWFRRFPDAVAFYQQTPNCMIVCDDGRGAHLVIPAAECDQYLSERGDAAYDVDPSEFERVLGLYAP